MHGGRLASGSPSRRNRSGMLPAPYRPAKQGRQPSWAALLANIANIAEKRPQLAPVFDGLCAEPPMLPPRLSAALQAFRRARPGARATVEPAATVRHCRTLARRSGSRSSTATRSVVGIAGAIAVFQAPEIPRYMGFMGHSCGLPLCLCPWCPGPPRCQRRRLGRPDRQRRSGEPP